MTVAVQDENEYEDLLALWSDLESGLGVILGNPGATQEFPHRVIQYDRWMQSLLQRDTDVGLYLLFQLASNSPVGYSASHALVCAVLCHLVCSVLSLNQTQRDSLVRSAMTMNLAMTALQDELANQKDKPSKAQRVAIQAHAIKGAMMLGNLGVTDEDWIEIVANHHAEPPPRVDPLAIAGTKRLAHILALVDRYAAMISPRANRAGRSAAESARAILSSSPEKSDEVARALVRAVGLCPPGTYVRLGSEELAVVVRRSSKPNYPNVAIFSKPNGDPLHTPHLHDTSSSSPYIRSAMPSNAVRARLNHFQILKLGDRANDAA